MAIRLHRVQPHFPRWLPTPCVGGCRGADDHPLSRLKVSTGGKGKPSSEMWPALRVAP